MSADIITLPERKPPPPAPADFPKDVAQFYCMHCNSAEFRVYVPGDLYCCGCKAFIKNLIVRKAP